MVARVLTAALGAGALSLVAVAPAHAVATIAADTTRGSGAGDPLVAGRSPSLVAGPFQQPILRFRVAGLTGPPAGAVLRLRVTAPTIDGLAVRALPPAFGEDDGTPAELAPGPTIATVPSAAAGTWAQWDVTSAVQGNGDVGLQISGPLLDPASFSSREGADAPQLVVTPDDDRATRLAGLLEPGAAQTFVAHARDNLDNSLDALDVIAAPAGQGIPGRYVGVHHTLTANVLVSKLVTSNNLTTWTHRADLDAHASQPTLAALPDGGFVLAVERDAPDPQYVSASNLVLRHYAGWAALVAGTFDREVSLPRTLAPTAEGTPSLNVTSWNGPDASQIVVRFHYLKNINVDRQASGTLTNFGATGWAPQPDAPINDLFIGLGTRGNLGDRADLTFEGHPFAILEAQSVKSDFGAWRWYLYDRMRNEARRLALRLPAGSYALGNPTVRALPGPTGSPLLLVSGFAFSQGAGPGEAGQFIALRNASTDLPAQPTPDPSPEPAPPPPPAPIAAAPPAAARPGLPVPMTVVADTAAPAATVSARSQKLATTIAVTVGCTDEPCRAAASGTVRVPKLGRSRVRTYRVTAAGRQLGQGSRVTLRLALSSTARAAIRRALRARKRVVVRVRISVTDDPGNARELVRQFRLTL